MAKKEKIAIRRDKRMEPIDNELDQAMGLLDNANQQISDLLASLDEPAPAAGEGAPEASRPEAEKDPVPEASPESEGESEKSE